MFLLGNAIRGVSFGGGNAVGRRRREVEKTKTPQTDKRSFWHSYKPHKSTKFRPQPHFGIPWKPSPPQPPSKYSSVATNFSFPSNITFVLCFWIKTQSKFAQLISVTEKIPEKKLNYYNYAWPRRFPLWRPTMKNKIYKKEKEKNIINVSILRGYLKLELGYKRIKR